jgi:hypothetical protein
MYVYSPTLTLSEDEIMFGYKRELHMAYKIDDDINMVLISRMLFRICGPGSSVSIVTELGAGRFGDRIPVGARFSAPVQTDPGAHPASCTMGNRSFPGVESGRGVTLTPHPLLLSRSKNRVQLYLYSP